jgi:twitching motility protein PilJ
MKILHALPFRKFFSEAGAAAMTGQPVVATASRSLPVIGRWPVARQFQLLLVLLAGLLLAAALLITLHNREAAQSAAYVSTATEMQMLSQRMANSAQQAAQGVPSAFPQLRDSRDQFIADLRLLREGGERNGTVVAPSPGATQDTLAVLAKQWMPVEKNINLILAQERGLVDLKKLEGSIQKAAPELSLLAQELAVAAIDAREPYGTVTFARQLHADVANFDFINALRQLSTDNPNPQVALNLGSNTRKYQQTLNALLGISGDNTSVRALSDPLAKRKAAELNRAFTPFATSVQTIITAMSDLARAKQGSREVYAASENLLQQPAQLAADYQSASSAKTLYFAGAVLFALLALCCLFLLGRVFLDDARRRARQSELENQRNQEAILRLLDEMSKVADGDLTVQAKVTEDVTGAIADSINFTIEQVRGLVSGITRAANQVTHATGNAQKIATQLLAATQKQSTEIQSTGQSVLQIAQSINRVSDNATQSAKVAQNSLSAAEKGSQAVQNAIRGMDEIREQIQETSKRIKRLGESSQEIGEIVQLITGITEQTNVLALNAAIQAASAGEAGRGFAVVAEEVQRLAERSAEATKHITEIVKSIQQDTQNTVEAMERSTQGVVEGARVADEAGQALHEIEAVSTRLAELIGAISNATQEQAKSAAKVATSMKGILDITQLTTAGTQKTAQSASELITLATELKSSVSGFKLV